jgi:hypothetical protein
MARDVKINGVTYTGVSVVQVPLAEGGTARFMQVNGAPGALEKWKAGLKINNSTYPNIGQMRFPLAEGEGYALYLYGNGDWEATYRVAPGSVVQVGDFVKITKGLFPSATLYPSGSTYPSNAPLVEGLGGNSTGADGVALTDGTAGELITIYIPA